MRLEESPELFLAHLRDGLLPSADLQLEAAKMAYDLEQPHIVAMLQLFPPYSSASDQTMQRALTSIQARFAHALVCQQGYLVTMLLPYLSAKLLQNRLQELLQTIPDVRIGVGQVCRRISEYRQGFAEAAEALATGKYLPGEPRLVCFNDLGSYRYLVALARQEMIADHYQDIVCLLAAQDDLRKGRELLRTLEVYLECGGDARDTSERLVIHRNTLSQRLTSIQVATGINLEQMDLWLPLQLAVKIHRIRRLMVQFR